MATSTVCNPIFQKNDIGNINIYDGDILTPHDVYWFSLGVSIFQMDFSSVTVTIDVLAGVYLI